MVGWAINGTAEEELGCMRVLGESLETHRLLRVQMTHHGTHWVAEKNMFCSWADRAS